MSHRESDTNETTTTTNNRLRTRRVSSEPKSPTLSNPRRFPSPNVRSKSPSTSTLHVPTRAFSAERRRPSTEAHFAPNVTAGSKRSESLWPKTMQNLNDSFQADNRKKTVSLKANNSVEQNISFSRPKTVVKKPSMVGKSSKPLERANISPSIRRLSMEGTSSKPLETITFTPSVKRLSRDRTPLDKIAIAPSARRLSLDGTSSKNMEFITNAPSVRRLSIDGTSSHTLETDRNESSVRRLSVRNNPSDRVNIAPSTRRLSVDGTSINHLDSVTITPSTRRLSTDWTSNKHLETVSTAPFLRRLSVDGTSSKSIETNTVASSVRRLSMDSMRSESLDTITIAPSVRRLSMDGTTIKHLETDTISPSISRLSGDVSSSNPCDTVTVGSSFSRLTIAPPVKRLSTEGLSSKPSPMITIVPSVKRLSLDGTTNKPVQKSASDLFMLMSENGTQRPSSSSSRPQSPTMPRGISPSRAKGVKGTSPSRIRPSSPSKSFQNSGSVPSFHADVKKWKRDSSDTEDAHQLRLLYNRHLQWRFANARTDDLLRSQKRKVETRLYNLWRLIIGLLDSVTETMSDLQQMKFTLKLYSILDSQVSILNEWTSMERDHTNAVTWAIQALQDTTVRLPLTRGARGDIKTAEASVSSAIDVMSSMGASLCSILSRVEAMNRSASELADVVALEGAMLVEYESLLCSTEALQVKDYSLRIHLLQMMQACKNR